VLYKWALTYLLTSDILTYFLSNREDVAKDTLMLPSHKLTEKKPINELQQ